MCDIHSSDVLKLLIFLKYNHNIDFSGYAPRSFERRINKFILQEQLKGPINIIEHINQNSDYLNYLISEITVNVTSLFRDPSSWLALRSQLENSRLRNNKSIKIWVAGCSTGEEVISITIILYELGLLNKTEILATDLNYKAISLAKKGIILKPEFPQLKKAYIESGGTKELSIYFNIHKEKLVFNQNMTKKTTFEQHNLISDVIINHVDLIICRNVLIYFSQELQNTVITRFHESCNKEAYLFLGRNESLDCIPSSSLYQLINYKEKIYAKV